MISARHILPVMAGSLATALPASADPIRAEVRAELVSLEEQAGVSASSGDLGRIGVPEEGFCAYAYGEGGAVEITDTSGTYKEGPTPDGCFAPDDADAPSFTFSCPRGETIRFRLDARSEREGVDFSAAGFEVDGGRINGSPPAFELTCEAPDGIVTIRARLGFTLTPDTEEGSGSLGYLDLETEY